MTIFLVTAYNLIKSIVDWILKRFGIENNFHSHVLTCGLILLVVAILAWISYSLLYALFALFLPSKKGASLDKAVQKKQAEIRKENQAEFDSTVENVRQVEYQSDERIKQAEKETEAAKEKDYDVLSNQEIADSIRGKLKRK
jgi:hypothetical protein